LSASTADGWLLVTLWFAGPVTRRDPAAWRNVVATADWINHAILSYEEASAGVRTLAILAVPASQEKSRGGRTDRACRAGLKRPAATSPPGSAEAGEAYWIMHPVQD
jgi:hypothetical protein